MIEPEVACNDSNDNMRLQEEFVSLSRAARARAPAARSSRSSSATSRSSSASCRRSRGSNYTDAVALLQQKGSETKWGDDLGAEDEALIVADYDTPVFVFNYPKEAKAFYMKENPADPRTVLCDDCLAPEGYGEIIGGSQREDDYDKLARAHPGGRAAARGVRLVPRPAEVRHLRALGLRPRTGAHGRVDLRHPAHARGDRVPEADASADAVNRGELVSWIVGS